MSSAESVQTMCRTNLKAVAPFTIRDEEKNNWGQRAIVSNIELIYHLLPTPFKVNLISTMKKTMSTFVFILIAVGFVYLVVYHKPSHHSEAELQKWFSTRLMEISNNLDDDIEKDKQGEYRHSGKQSFEKQGAITYVLFDKNYARFDISDKNNLNSQDIMDTAGYKTLQQKSSSLGLEVFLQEKEVEGDDVETFDELDEYIDDFPRYYTVTVSGW